MKSVKGLDNGLLECVR